MKRTVLLAALTAIGFGPAAFADPPKVFVDNLAARRNARAPTTYVISSDVTLHPQPSDMGRLTVPREIRYTEKLKIVIDPLSGEYRIDRRGKFWNQARQELEDSSGALLFHKGVLKTVTHLNGGKSGVGENGRAHDSTIIRDKFEMNPFYSMWHPIFYDMGIVPILFGHRLHAGQFHTYKSEDYFDCITPLKSPPKGFSPNGYSVPPVSDSLGDLTQFVELSTFGNITKVHQFRNLHQKKQVPQYQLEIGYGASESAASAPREWTVRGFQGDQPSRTERYKLESRAAPTPLTESDLEFPLEPGMIVAEITSDFDPAKPGSLIVHRVDDAGRLQPLQPSTGSRGIKAAVSIGILALLAILAIRYSVSRRSRR